MTTHTPYGPDAAAPPDYPQHSASSAYPTSPPWATPPDAPPTYGSVTPYDAPYPQHGQLLVPFPEEMYNASRPKPPPWWPVAVWTFFFGVLGIVSASRRAKQAKRGRNSPAPYWVAWGATMAVGSMLSGVVVAVGVPVYLNYREGVVTKVVESSLKNSGQLEKSAGVTATSATCAPVGPRNSTGTRLYDCTLALDDGRTGTLRVTADAGGNWTAVP
jgi:hypothetical protein